MTIELSVKDRLVIISMLKPNGSLQDMVIVFDIIKAVRFTEEEKALIEYREVDDKIEWNMLKEPIREFTFSYDEIGILKASVEKLDEEGKVTLYNLETCIKINSL